MDTKQHSTSRKLTQEQQRRINDIKTEYEDAGHDSADLVPDDELYEVITALYHIIIQQGLNPQSWKSWVIADGIYMQTVATLPAVAGV